MTRLTSKILGIISIISFTFSCNKIDQEVIPFDIDLSNDIYQVNNGESIEINFLENDIIEGNDISVNLIGSENLAGKLEPIENSTKYIYTASNSQLQNDFFSYEVCCSGECKTANVNIEITSIPDSCLPYTRDDFFTSEDGEGAITINEILNNDINDCFGWDIGTFEIIKSPEYGFINVINNELNFNSYRNDWRKDQINYQICGNNGQCFSAAINIINGSFVISTQL